MLQRLLVLSSRYKTLKSNFKSNFNAIEVLQVQLGRPKIINAGRQTLSLV